MSDRIFGVAGIILAVFFAWQATLIQESFIQDPVGPKVFPLIIAAILALASLAFILRPDPEPHWPAFGRLFEIVMAAAVMFAYALLLPQAGFVVATAFAAAYLAWRLGAPPLNAVIAGIGIAFAIYVAFHLVLGLSLARGPWGF